MSQKTSSKGKTPASSVQPMRVAPDEIEERVARQVREALAAGTPSAELVRVLFPE